MLPVVAFGLVIGLLSQGSQASVLNGEFSSGLNDWMAAGSVAATASQEARLGDEDPFYGILYQGVALGSGNYTLSFDFDGSQLSSTVPGGTFPDSFFASLYFIDDLSSFSLDPLNPVFDDVLPLFDLDFGGVICIGVPGPCAGDIVGAGGSWLSYSASFTNAYQYAIPVFELYGGNQIVDSAVLVDNVRISAAAVPLPGTLLLVATGALLLRRRGRAWNTATSIYNTDSQTVPRKLD